MNKIPKKIKNLVFGLSILIFLIFNFGLETTTLFGLAEIIQEKTNYSFLVEIDKIDFIAIASIPIFGMLLNSKRNSFKISEFIIDSLKILLSIIIMFGIGLYILTFIGKPTNPLIPQDLITEPIFLYSTLIIAIGIFIPFLLTKQNKNKTKIENI